MRLLFLFLLILNLVFFAIQEGYLGPIIPDGKNPERMSSQFAADKIRITPLDPSAPSKPTAAASPRVACIEFGGFSPDDVKKIEPLIDPLVADGRGTTRHADEQASYIVYLPPFKTRADAEHASSELRRIGVEDFFIIQDNGPFKLAISLGIFRTEEAAKAQLTALSQLGVKNAKTGLRATTVAKTYYLFRNPENDLLAKLNEIKARFPNEDLHDCATASATGPVAASNAESAATSPKGT